MNQPIISILILLSLTLPTSAEHRNVLRHQYMSGQQEIWVFDESTEGLVTRAGDGSTWSWLPLGRPSGITLWHGVAPVIRNFFVLGWPHVERWIFATGVDGSLYRATIPQIGPPSWENQGRPGPGVKAVFAPSAAAWLPALRGASSLVYVFVRGDNGHLYSNSFEGGSWWWTNHGTPPETTVGWGMSAVSYLEGNEPRIYVFVMGQDSRLYVRHWNGHQWSWVKAGNPPGGAVHGAPAAVTYRKQNRQWLHAFSVGGNHLWEYYSDGLSWKWRDHGKPSWASRPGVPELDPSSNLAVTTYAYGADQRAIFVFLDHNWSRLASRSTYDGSNWKWSAHGTPAGSPALGRPLGAAYLDGAILPQPFCFVRYNSTGLAQRQADFINWSWIVHGAP